MSCENNKTGKKYYGDDDGRAEYKWAVITDYGTNLCYTLWQAFHNWLWNCGVPAKIAFWWVRFKRK